MGGSVLSLYLCTVHARVMFGRPRISTKFACIHFSYRQALYRFRVLAERTCCILCWDLNGCCNSCVVWCCMPPQRRRVREVNRNSLRAVTQLQSVVCMLHVNVARLRQMSAASSRDLACDSLAWISTFDKICCIGLKIYRLIWTQCGQLTIAA